MGYTHFDKVVGVNGLYVGAHNSEVPVIDGDAVFIQVVGGVPYYYWANSSGVLRFGTVKPTPATIDTAGDFVGVAGTGLAEYGFFYQTVADVAGTIAADDGKALFETAGPNNTAGFSMIAASGDITVTNAGVYEVWWEITCAEAGAMALYIDAAKQAGTTFGTGAGTQNISGTAILSIAAGEVISLRTDNCPAALTLQLAGTTNTGMIVAAIRFLQLA